MANISTMELLFLFDAASYALYTGNRALGQLLSTLINSSLYDVLTLSVLVAGVVLAPRSRRDTRNTALLLATGAMDAGTTAYFALRVRNLSHDAAAVYSNAASLFIDLQACYSTSTAGGAGGTGSTQCPGLQGVSNLAGPSDLPPQYCAGTAALTVNAVLGSAILCWCACALGPRKRVVPILLSSLILATCALGIADTGAVAENPRRLDGPGVGAFFVGKGFGLVAAAALAFVTVLAASALICCKTWELRAGIRSRLHQGSAQARVGGALVLTVELGVVHCVIWALVVGGTATMNQSLGALEDPATGFEELVYAQSPASFVQGFWVFDLGTLTPLTALYPVLLAVVVALNTSPHSQAEREREGFGRISDPLRPRGGVEPPHSPHSPTQWRRKFRFLLASPPPALLVDQRASGEGHVEVFALGHTRMPSGWDEGDAASVGKGGIL